jgi:hypothetical protein
MGFFFWISSLHIFVFFVQLERPDTHFLTQRLSGCVHRDYVHRNIIEELEFGDLILALQVFKVTAVAV